MRNFDHFAVNAAASDTVSPSGFVSVSCEEDLHLLAVDHARHTKQKRRGISCRAALQEIPEVSVDRQIVLVAAAGADEVRANAFPCSFSEPLSISMEPLK